jgi:hypothetical protein
MDDAFRILVHGAPKHPENDCGMNTVSRRSHETACCELLESAWPRRDRRGPSTRPQSHRSIGLAQDDSVRGLPRSGIIGYPVVAPTGCRKSSANGPRPRARYYDPAKQYMSRAMVSPDRGRRRNTPLETHVFPAFGNPSLRAPDLASHRRIMARFLKHSRLRLPS